MLDLGLSIILGSLSVVTGILIRELDKLLAPIDAATVSKDELLAFENQAIQWRFVPLAREIAATGFDPLRMDLAKVRVGYNSAISQLETAKFWVQEFDRGRRNLDRLLVGGAVILVPAAAAAAAPIPVDGAALAVAGLFAGFIGFLFAACYAWRGLARARERYRGAPQKGSRNGLGTML
jgi:hypothetical protein